MERVINVYVNGNTVQKDVKNAGTKGEAEVTALHIVFNKMWRGYSKRIVFRDAKGENPTVKLLFNSVADIVYNNNLLEFVTGIPGEALTEEGWCSFTVEGYAIDDNGVEKIMISATDTLYVKANDTDYIPAEPTENEASQLRVEVSKAVEQTGQIVKEAKESCEKNANTMSFWEVWDNNKTYMPLNKVQNRGSSYICDVMNTGVEPFFDVVDGKGKYWTLIAEKGEMGIGVQGEKGERGPEGPRGINGVSVQTYGMVSFFVDDNGHLICRYTGDEEPNYYIGDNGHLYLEV